MTSRSLLLVIAGAFLLAAFSGRAAEPTPPPVPPKLYLIGGSTMATFPEARPVVGWGQILPQFFKIPAQVDNRALSGRSTKSFIDQGHWDKVIGDLRAGDFLIMCWGTNDSANDPARRTDPRGSFRANLLRFITEVRAQGGVPILATQVAHRKWDAAGKFVEPTSEYVLVNRELAASERVPLLEMFDRTVELEKSLGPEGSIALHLYLEPGVSDYYPNGTKDNTHYNRHGATRVAELAVQEIRRLGLPLTSWLASGDPSAPTAQANPASR